VILVAGEDRDKQFCNGLMILIKDKI
jgi:hypothetical protein